MEQQPEEQEVVEAQTAVVSVVEAGSQEVLHQVHFTMEVDGTTQEQQVSGVEWLPIIIHPKHLFLKCFLLHFAIIKEKWRRKDFF